MSDGAQTNAMAEIALALAMGFFSIMVLAMVSMGAGVGVPPLQVLIPLPADGISVAPTVSANAAKNAADLSDALTVRQSVSADLLLIFHKGQYIDAGLQVVDPSHFARGKDRIVLAVDPGLSLSQAAAARRKISGVPVTVTPLDKQWMHTLKEMTQ